MYGIMYLQYDRQNIRNDKKVLTNYGLIFNFLHRLTQLIIENVLYYEYLYLYK
jgi:hypothetical protein